MGPAWFRRRNGTPGLLMNWGRQHGCSMHPMDLAESGHAGQAVDGMVPAASLRVHAGWALDRLRVWLDEVGAGQVVRTRSGSRRVLPRSVRVLAREYVRDHLDDAWFDNQQARQYAWRYYTYALEVAIGEKLEELAVLVDAPTIGVRNLIRPWRGVIRQLGLDD